MQAIESIKNNEKESQEIDPKIKQKMMEQYYSELMSATQSGETKLPGSDIPVTQGGYINDPNIIPSYIPKPALEEREQPEFKPVYQYQQPPPIKKSGLLDFLLIYLQTPLLIGLCYFIFQMPFFKTSLVAMLPLFYVQEGSLNLYGIILVSILFSCFFMGIEKVVRGLQEMD